MEPTLFIPRLAVQLACAGSVLLATLALATGLRYQQLKQDALRRSQEVGIDAARLRQMRRQRSFLLRLSDRYDASDRAQKIRNQLAQANLDLKPSEYLAYRILAVILLIAVNYFFIRVDTGWSASLRRS